MLEAPHLSLSLAEIERMNRAANDKAACALAELEAGLEIPHSDLDLFFDGIGGRRMLDVGCGTGRYVSCFTSAGLEYSGIDFSSGMLAVARERNPAARFFQMSYHRLAFANESFDGIWACCVFGMEPKRQAPSSLAEMRRVLRPGGVMVLVLPYLVDWSTEEIDTEDERFGAKYYSVWNPAEFEDALLKAGFGPPELVLRPEHGAMTFVVTK